MSESTVAGRELRDGCRIANRGDVEGMTRTFATLLCTPAHRRTLDQLADAGIFITPSRRYRISAENARVLFSDEGLLLWLRFAASPSAYRDVFVDSSLSAVGRAGGRADSRTGNRTEGRAANRIADNSDNARLANALRVLVACGRDTTNDVPASEQPDSMYLPLSHLCSRVAPEWLPTLLAVGSDINQTSHRGVSLLTTAMAAQAFRAKRHDLDLLVPHDCLYTLALSLRNRGASLTHRSDSGSPPAMLLALNGLCGAAEVLLSMGASCNMPDRNGNTLMHYLAATTRTPGHAFCAFFMFTTALRYGGDPNLPNGDGRTALSLLRGSLRVYADALHKMIVATREMVRFTITREAPLRHANLSPVTTAMTEEARRLYSRGWDPLLPHASLFALAISLRAGGVDLTQRHPDGTPPVLWLTHHGFCGAAEVLLALSRNSNTPLQDGNTLLHLLAAARRHGKPSFLTDYMLCTALRYGGDPTQPNAAGFAALASLPADMTRFLRASLAFYRGTALQAGRAVSRLYPVNTHFDLDLMRHSAADL
ncbi:ankyrin repeat domain-containing protein [Pandoraea pulmonicola]|uniref:Ankyrin repeats (3 copies) n=2 Tax=Pandoraea pulmonicola TaxID=93221 RepID=A0AAJ4ZFZ0_PANPU|nr:ankyrin repeat domain-containing protein [Pandoraea pulmonicola]SUA92621.1 Ankyrin repeats (3 copies) [Pandoraea pulmonicola]